MIIFLFCSTADRLTNEGIDVHNEIYYTNWYNWSEKNKTLLKIMLQQAQQPNFIKIGKVGSLTLDTFKTIGNTTYSYFTMLQRMRS